MSAKGASGPPPFAVVAFWTFVVGGLGFGAIFLGNWQTLAGRQPPPAPIVVAAGPVRVTVPVSIAAPPPIVLPPRPAPAQLTSGIASAVKNVLPEWSGKDRVNILLLGI